ncbi:MAG: hypothetical protein LUE17_15495 [Planctomycetaceae bacterium]|nr:hypothetical protein [Planctomycetaceae bacterium]
MGKHVGFDGWEAAGLPGRPMVRTRGEVDRDLMPDQLIADQKGCPILVHGRWSQADHAATIMGEHVEREIQVVYFFHPQHHHLDVFGYALARTTRSQSLSLLERAALAALAEYCEHYRPGLKVGVPLVLPRVLQDESALVDGCTCEFTDEARAYMVADVCSDLFEVDGEVVDDSDGWIVVIRDDTEGMIDATRMAALQGICLLLQRYAVQAATMGERIEAPDIRAVALTGRTTHQSEMARMLAEIKESCSRLEAAHVGETAGVAAGQ